jgi:hypothetical protein
MAHLQQSRLASRELSGVFGRERSVPDAHRCARLIPMLRAVLFEAPVYFSLINIIKPHLCALLNSAVVMARDLGGPDRLDPSRPQKKGIA